MNDKLKQSKEETSKIIQERLSLVRKKYAVLSNKGGVGKTTVSVLLTRVLESKGFRVGLLDADIHGPSTVKALGMEDLTLRGDADGTIYPLEKGNVKLVSTASMLKGKDSPLIWRGPMKANLIKQFLSDVSWGELDYLVIDSPPGTGDEPMSVLQLIKNIDGGIVVTTPQEIALLDSRKCVNFLKELKVPVSGIIENMSGFICPHCQKETEIFKKGGGRKAAEEMNVPFLGSIPFDPEIVRDMDSGRNILEDQDSPLYKDMSDIAVKLQ